MKKLLSIIAILFAMSICGTAFAGPDAPDMDKAISKLPKEKAEEFRNTMQQAHEQNKGLYDQARSLHDDMHSIMMADEFDKDAFIAKSTELRGLHDKIGVNLDEAFASAVAELSPKERKMLARAMEQPHQANKNGAQPQKSQQ